MSEKDMPVEVGQKERADWKKQPYAVCIIRSEEVENRYFREKATCSKCGATYDVRPEDGICTHVIGASGQLICGGDVYWPDKEVERTQYRFTFEVLEGEKKGDWAWLFAPHRFGVEPNSRGKLGWRAEIARAIDPDYDLSQGIYHDNRELLFRPMMAMVEPKPEPKYAKFVSFYPVAETDLTRLEERCQAIMMREIGAVAVDESGQPVDPMSDAAVECQF